MSHILILAAIHDEPIANLFQIQFCDEALYSLEQLGHEITIGACQIGEATNCSLGHEQDMQRITWFGMMEGNECFGFSQASNRNGKTHVAKDPTNDQLSNWRSGYSKQQPHF